jgi:hypothetical protein
VYLEIPPTHVNNHRELFATKNVRRPSERLWVAGKHLSEQMVDRPDETGRASSAVALLTSSP